MDSNYEYDLIRRDIERRNRLIAEQTEQSRRAAAATEALARVQREVRLEKQHENLLKSLELNVITKVEYSKKALDLGVISRSKYIKILIDDGSLNDYDILWEKYNVDLITFPQYVQGLYELDPEFAKEYLRKLFTSTASEIESCVDCDAFKSLFRRHKEYLECAVSLKFITSEECERLLQVSEEKGKVLRREMLHRRLKIAVISLAALIIAWIAYVALL